jgi:hypothetical protein
MTHAVALFLTLLASAAGVDTTLAIKRGTRLEVDNFAGDIQVRTWSKDALRIEANHSHRTRVEIDQEGRLIRLTAVGHMMPGMVDYKLTVPPWMPLDLHGMSAEISVDGSKASVTAKTVNGDVRIKGGEEMVSASSIQGLVEISDAKGRVEASSLNQGVNLKDIDGDVVAESMNGVVILDKVQAKSLEASSVNGNIVFLGPMLKDGSYSLSTHNGTVVVGLPEKPDVNVSVATFSGAFSSSIPVTIERTHRARRFSFTLGSGSAKLELESFSGSVQLARYMELAKRLPSFYSQTQHDDDHDMDRDQDQDDETPAKDKTKPKDKE